VRRFLVIPLAVALLSQAVLAADKDEPKKVADTRKKLEQTKITVKWKEIPLGDVLEEIFKEENRGIPYRSDKNAVTLNTKVTYEAKDKTIAEILNDLGELKSPSGLGWYIWYKPDAYQGSVWIEKSKARGYAEGQAAPDKKEDVKKDDKKPTKDDKKPTKDDKKPKDEPKDDVKKDDKKDPPKDEPKADDPDEIERKANKLLALAKMNLDAGKEDKARDRLVELLKKYKDSKAAEEAQKLLDKLKEKED
jgi:hypothetical protein